MKNLLLIALFAVAVSSCKTSDKVTSSGVSEIESTAQDTVRIANEAIEYEIIIIEPGFNSWMIGRAKPQGYYSQEFLESRNTIYVAEWNNRVLNPMRYSPNLYEMQIDYSPFIDYGYEVNYKLYYYFIYFQINYKQRLAGFVPRI